MTFFRSVFFCLMIILVGCSSAPEVKEIPRKRDNLRPYLGADVGQVESSWTILKEYQVSDLRIRLSELHYLKACARGKNLLVEVDGPINSDTSLFIERIFEIYGPCVDDKGRNSYPIVYLNSSGGSLIDGYKIGRVFRRYGITAYVHKGQVCASACAVAFLGAEARGVWEGGTLIFHAPYTVGRGGFIIDCSDVEVANSLKAYYREMIDNSNVEHIFKRTMSYCSNREGWTLNKAAADLMRLTNLPSVYKNL